MLVNEYWIVEQTMNNQREHRKKQEWLIGKMEEKMEEIKGQAERQKEKNRQIVEEIESTR